MKHGRSCYINHACRCKICSAASRVYHQRWRERHPNPNRLVSAERTWRHLCELSEQGVGVRSVADVTGLSTARLGSIRAGSKGRVTLSTERRVLSVTAEAYAGGAKVPAGKAKRMVKALRREGFTYKRLGDETGLWPRSIKQITTRTWVRGKTQMRLERFYNLLNQEAA